MKRGRGWWLYWPRVAFGFCCVFVAAYVVWITVDHYRRGLLIDDLASALAVSQIEAVRMEKKIEQLRLVVGQLRRGEID